ILPNPDARLYNLEMTSNLGSSLEFLRLVRESLYSIARTPEIALGNMTGVGALSGVALAILFQPLLDKTESKRMVYGEMLENLNARLLVLNGSRESVDDIDCKNTWPELLPRDDVAERQSLQIDDQLGILSKQTLSDKLGYDLETEVARKKDEQAK